MQQPTSALAILFTDVVGSTRLWEKDPDRMGSVMARHDRLLETSVVGAGGRVVKGLGDGVLATFRTSGDAVRAAIEAQRRLWPDPPAGLGMKVRMAITCGEALERDGDVFGPVVIQCARLVDAAHGGQIVLADSAAEGLEDGVVGLCDLGVHHLRDLAEPVRIHQIVADGLESGFPSLRTLHAFSHNLPTRLSSLIGREGELLSISSLLTQHRLVTLTGPGGSGKTRLALQVGADMLERFADGTWLANLLRVRDSDHVAESVAADLGIAVDVASSATDALVAAFVGSETLLIVDNCEHVLDSAAAMIAQILEGTDRLRILATSRAALRVAGERVFTVDPLAVPPATESDAASVVSCPSVQLFAERLAEFGARTRLKGNERVAGDIVRQVDGLPLAIELAAGRTQYMTLAELSKALAENLDVLRNGPSDDARHETIRSTIAWSFDLLSSDERLLLERLTIFTNGWYRDEAISVCSLPPLSSLSVETLLESLVDRSLVSTRELEAGVTRFRLLEQVRQFAAERLDQSSVSELRGRLVDYFVTFFAQYGSPTIEPVPVGEPDSVLEWMPLMIEDISNLVLAIETGLDSGRRVDALRILADGAWEVFYVQSGYVSRYYSWLDRALEDVTAQDPKIALGAIEGAGFCASATTRPERMVELHAESLRRATEVGLAFVEVHSRIGLGIGLIRTGRVEEAAHVLGEAAALAQGRYPMLQLEAELWIAQGCETGLDSYQRMKQLLVVAGELGNTLNTSFMWWFFGWEAMDRGQLDLALTSVDRLLEVRYYRLMPVVQAHLHDLRCRILSRMGRQQEAEETLGRAFESTRRVIGPNWAVTGVWYGAAEIAEYGEDRERALGYLRQGLAKARRGDIALHVGMFGLRLIPYLLDDGDVASASDLLREAETALVSANRLDEFYLPMAELRRSQVAEAEGRLVEAAERLLGVIPHDADDPSDYSLLIEQLEVAGSLLGAATDPRASEVFAVVDRWHESAGVMPNPVSIRRRRGQASRAATTVPAGDRTLTEGVCVARQALGELVSSA